MGRKASGKERTDIIRKKQKNGSVYVYQRVSIYNPEKGYYVSKGQTLIGKETPGSDEIQPTRPKSPDGSRKSHAEQATESPARVSATRTRYGAEAIMEHIGKTSGIDADVYASCDVATAKRIIALARYYFQSDGDATSHLESWQLTHSMAPYNSYISEDAAHDLFKRVGADETIAQSIFYERVQRLEDDKVLAYDASTVSTYGLNHGRARYGYNKQGDGLEADKIFTFYSIDNRQPVCFYTVPGNIPDVSAVHNASGQLEVLGLKGAELVTDCGFYSESNLSELFQSPNQFLSRAQIDAKWIKPEVDRALNEISETGNMSPDEAGTYGKTVCLTHAFTKIRKYGSTQKGLKAGDTEQFTRRLYLHVYFNDVNRVKKDRALDDKLLQLRKAYEAGERNFNPGAQAMIDKYMIIQHKRNGEAEILFNTKKIHEAKKYHGVFVLVASKEKDKFKALRKYRKREWIEDFFEELKQRVGCRKYRVWDDLTLDGKKVVQFVALCYYEQFSKELSELKSRLGRPNGDPAHDKKVNLDKEKTLKNWLGSKSIEEILVWFDAVDRVEVSTPAGSRAWTTEVTEKEQMLLEKLGISL